MSNDYKCWGKTKQEIRTRGLGDIGGRMVKKCPFDTMTYDWNYAELSKWSMQMSGEIIPDAWNSACKGPGVGVHLASRDLSRGQRLVKNKEGCGDLWALLRTWDFYTE